MHFHAWTVRGTNRAPTFHREGASAVSPGDASQRHRFVQQSQTVCSIALTPPQACLGQMVPEPGSRPSHVRGCVVAMKSATRLANSSGLSSWG